MFTRLSAVCLAAALVCAAAVQAQQQTQPGQEGPPSVEFPPPRVEQGPAPRPDGPPPRVEGVPDDRIPPRAETPRRDDDNIPRRPSDTPPRAQVPDDRDRPPPRDDRPPPRADRPGPNTGDRCGAVAYTADGAFGGSYGMEDCREAERLAVDECRRESTDKEDCSRGVVTRRNEWFYIQFCRDGRDWTTHVTTNGTLSGVNQAGMEWARRSKFGASNCRLVPNGLFHAGGLHTRM
jgi:hypothetical protein